MAVLSVGTVHIADDAARNAGCATVGTTSRGGVSSSFDRICAAPVVSKKCLTTPPVGGGTEIGSFSTPALRGRGGWLSELLESHMV